MSERDDEDPLLSNRYVVHVDVEPSNIQPPNGQPPDEQPTNGQPSNVQPSNGQPPDEQQLNEQPPNIQPLKGGPSIQLLNEEPTAEEIRKALRNLFIFVEVHFLLFFFMPIFTIFHNKKANTTFSAIAISISIVYQSWNAYHVGTQHFNYTIPSVSINRTDFDVLGDQVLEIAKDIVWIWYLSVRFLMIWVFWCRRQVISKLFTLIYRSILRDKDELRKLLEWSILIVFCTICLIVGEVICCWIAYIEVGPRLCWQCLASSIYSGTIIISLSVTYFFAVCGLESMFIELFETSSKNLTEDERKSGPSDDQDPRPIQKLGFSSDQELQRSQLQTIRNKLDSISKVMRKIEQTLGFFIFWIFTLNFAEFSFAVIVIPHFEHFSLSNEADMIWFLKVIKNSIILALLTIVVIKVDQVRRTAKLMFADFKQLSNRGSVTTETQSLVSDVAEAVKCDLTSWNGCFELKRSIILTYLTTIIIFCNLAFTLIRKVGK